MRNDLSKRRDIFLIIIFISMVVNTLPPLLTTIQEDFKITPGISSIIPFVSTVGSITINFIGGFFIASMGIRLSLKINLLFVIIGAILFFTFINIIMISIGTFFLGLAFGGLFMTLTSSFAHLESKYQNYGFLHACYGFGAMLAPLLVYIFLVLKIQLRYIYLLYAIIGTLLLIFMSDKFDNIKYKKTSFSDTKRLIKNPIILVSFIVFFLYSGSETSYATWEGNLFTNGFGYSKEISSIFLSMFWFLFTFTRLVSDFLSKKIGHVKLLLLSSLLAFLNISIMLIFKINILFLATAILIAPFFPTFQKFMNSKIENKDIGLYSGLIYGFDSLGVMIAILTMGFVIDFSPFIAYLIPTFSFITIFILLTKIYIRK